MSANASKQMALARGEFEVKSRNAILPSDTLRSRRSLSFGGACAIGGERSDDGGAAHCLPGRYGFPQGTGDNHGKGEAR